MLISELDEIKGVGKITADTLRRRFKSMKKIREASLAELTAAIGPSKAGLVHTHFHPSDSGSSAGVNS